MQAKEIDNADLAQSLLDLAENLKRGGAVQGKGSSCIELGRSYWWIFEEAARRLNGHNPK